MIGNSSVNITVVDPPPPMPDVLGPPNHSGSFMSGWIPIMEAAKALGVTRRTMYDWINLPEPPMRFKKFGGLWMVRKEDII